MRWSYKVMGLGGLVFVGGIVAGCGDDESAGGGGAASTSSATTGSASNGSSVTTSASTSTSTVTSATTIASSSASTGGAAWAAPACNAVMGSPAVTFTTDEGATLATAPPVSGTGYTSLVALDVPNRLVAEHKGTIFVSEDAGCTWEERDQLPVVVYRMVAARGGLAYAFADNGSDLFRIDADGNATALDSGAKNIVGLGVDPADGMHVRIGDATGAQRNSNDGGLTWAKQGIPGATGGLVLGYRFAYDPSNIDHVLFGQASEGAQVSTDGGATWGDVTGLGANANAFQIVVSPVDGNVVWIESLEIGPDARHIYRSDDGGNTFVSVVDDTDDINLINGNLLAPHPTDRNVLYFVFGTFFQGYGTDVYRYDHATGLVTTKHNDEDDISAIVASPADPSILYVGIVSEEGG